MVLATSQYVLNQSLDQQIKKAFKIKQNDMQGFNQKDSQTETNKALKIATNTSYTNITRSKAYYTAALYQGLISKGIFSIWKIKTVIPYTQKSINYIEKAIILNPQNKDAVFSYAKIIKEAAKNAWIIKRYITIDINAQIRKAITHLDNLVDQSDKNIQKYKARLLNK
jgi:tetratricopeptide (TPR) repeat protein